MTELDIINAINNQADNIQFTQSERTSDGYFKLTIDTQYRLDLPNPLDGYSQIIAQKQVRDYEPKRRDVIMWAYMVNPTPNLPIKHSIKSLTIRLSRDVFKLMADLHKKNNAVTR